MHVDTDHLATLLLLQQADRDIAAVERQVQALPQRATILEARTKRRGIEQKADQIAELLADAEARYGEVAEEDARLAEKAARIQDEIDNAQGGYRDVQSRTRELEGVAKRRNTLEERIGEVEAELARIQGLRSQVDKLLADLDAREAAATEAFVKEGGALKRRQGKLQAERDQLAAQLPDELMARYDKAAARGGGVGLGRLAGGSCGVCRAAIDPGRLIDMRAQGNLANCPHCGRLLIVEE